MNWPTCIDFTCQCVWRLWCLCGVWLRRRLALAAWGSLDQVLVAAPRHRRCLGAAAASLGAAMAAFDPGARTLAAPEVVAGELRLALDRLGEVTGQIPPDEVLGRIFAGFCVGK